MFSERPGEHAAGAPPLSLCVGHLGESLEDGGSTLFFKKINQGVRRLEWRFQAQTQDILPDVLDTQILKASQEGTDNIHCILSS